MTLPAKTGQRIVVDFGRAADRRHDTRNKTSAADAAPPLFGRRAGLLVHLRDMADYARTEQGDKYIRFHGEDWEPVTQAVNNALCGILTRSLLCPVHRDDVKAVVSLLCSTGKGKPKRQRQVTPRTVHPRTGTQKAACGERYDGA